MKDTSGANLLLILLAVAGVAFVAVVWMYSSHFGPIVSDSHEVWGQFGDFLGGTLNPIFGFLTLVAIVMTLAVQSRQLDVAHEQLKLSRAELEATREELRKSAVAQQETAVALTQQARFAAISAKINAFSSAMQAIDHVLDRQRDVQLKHGLPVVPDQTLKERRDQLNAMIHSLVTEAEAA